MNNRQKSQLHNSSSADHSVNHNGLRELIKTLLDSGATCHIVSDLSLCISPIDTSQRPDVRALGGAKIRILGKAWVQYATTNVYGQACVYRHQAYIVDPKSGIKKNIVSTGLLRKEGGFFLDGINGTIQYTHVQSKKVYSLSEDQYPNASFFCTPHGELIQAARDQQSHAQHISLSD